MDTIIHAMYLLMLIPTAIVTVVGLCAVCVALTMTRGARG